MLGTDKLAEDAVGIRAWKKTYASIFRSSSSILFNSVRLGLGSADNAASCFRRATTRLCIGTSSTERMERDAKRSLSWRSVHQFLQLPSLKTSPFSRSACRGIWRRRGRRGRQHTDTHKLLLHEPYNRFGVLASFRVILQDLLERIQAGAERYEDIFRVCSRLIGVSQNLLIVSSPPGPLRQRRLPRY